MQRSRTDANLGIIVDTYERLGCSVKRVGHFGLPFDLLVGYLGQTHVVEVKDGDKPPSSRKLTRDEAAFKAEWKGGYRIVETPEDVIRHVEGIRGIRT